MSVACWNRWKLDRIVRWIRMLGGIVEDDRAAGCLQIVRARDTGCCSESFVLLRAAGCYESSVRRAAMLWVREFKDSTNRSRTRGVSFFVRDVSSHGFLLGIILFTLLSVQKTIPDATLGKLKGITREESCENARVALEYWMQASA